jgi:choline dehydrogenase-like flavoprotein
MIVDTATITGDLTLETDVCIIGSGAGGALAASHIAAAGLKVVVLEEGPYRHSGQFTQREEEMLPVLYDEHGLRNTVGAPALIVRGRTVGGSTLGSQCVCVRLPARLLAHWRGLTGLPLAYEDLAAAYEAVEATAHVRPLLPHEVNDNNLKLKLGADRRGFHNFLPHHNRIDCLGCGFCLLGCAYSRKADALTVHLPEALRHGAVVLPDCHVERIETRNGTVTGIQGRLRSRPRARSQAVHVRAAGVVLAAGALGSPTLWRRSQLPDPSQQVGRNLRLQPEVVLAAVFPESVRGWTGIPQSVIVDEFIDLDRAPEGGFLLMPTFAPPAMVASLLPGFGREARALMELYPRLALAAVVLHDRSSGEVRPGPDGQPSVHYALNDADRYDLLDGMRRLADIFFAAGAERVVLPYNDLTTLDRPGDYRAIDDRPLRVNDPLLISYRPQGTLRIGGDARRAVVDPGGESLAVRRLFVADASLFPTSSAFPPQLTVMALAKRTAETVVERLGRAS